MCSAPPNGCSDTRHPTSEDTCPYSMRLSTVVALLLPFLSFFLTFLSLPDAPPSDPLSPGKHSPTASPLSSARMVVQDMNTALEKIGAMHDVVVDVIDSVAVVEKFPFTRCR